MLYLKTVTRGLSICTTCLPSVIHAITICPSSSWLAKFKHQPSYYILCLFVIFFILTTPISSIIITYTSALPRIMILSSGCMVIFLYRHKRQSQHLHSTCLSPRVSAETRAPQSILMLMILFV
ncbi:vomeronasal type-1 receptor 105-like, partial [Trichechus inunguis]